MSRSKKNWDELVDYYGNYFPLDELFEKDANGNDVLKDIKGDKGDTGEKGRRGFRGQTGPKGEAGTDGIDGIDGDKGDTGEKGLKGEPEGLLHYKGELPTRTDLPVAAPGTEGFVYKVADTGYYYVSDGNGNWDEFQGIQSITGDKGEPGGKGDKGDVGPAGVKGDKLVFDDLTDAEIIGLTGAKGEKGDDGDSAYEIAVKGGFSGSISDWLNSIKGEKGKDGDKGDDGTKGDDGLKGAQGQGFTIVGNVLPGENPNTAPGYTCDSTTGGNALIDDSDGQLWICDGNGQWVDGGKMVGPEGQKGQKGDALLFDDLTPSNKDALKGEKGEIGELPLISALPSL